MLKPFLVARTNGGEISMLERLRKFKSEGADVLIHVACPSSTEVASREFLMSMGTPLKGQSYEVSDLKVQVAFGSSFHPFELNAQAAMEAHFLSVIETFKPDWVWVHYTDYFSVSSAIKWRADRVWVIQTDNEFPRLSALAQFPSLIEAYRNIKNIVVASRFIRGVCEAEFPGAKIIYLPNPVEVYAPSSVLGPFKYWLFVNPTAVKGVEFMLELAKEMPKENFVFVGNWGDQPCRADLPQNVKWLPRQASLEKLFLETKGLLMPSVWQEAFGRLVIEAMAYDVPVIASDRGALPETVGSGGLSIPLTKERWVQALQDVEGRRDFWVSAGRQRLAEYRNESNEIWKAILRDLHDS